MKTAARVIPASRDLLRSVQVYLTLPPPLRRVSGKSPYLFVARSGSPVSIDTADDIIVLDQNLRQPMRAIERAALLVTIVWPEGAGAWSQEAAAGHL